MNRKRFIESHGATCANWTWSWSFVNHDERFVIFGAWDRYSDGTMELVLSEEWRVNKAGRKSTGYAQSREHVRLVEEEGYRLFTFQMKYSEERQDDDGTGPAKIGGFVPELHQKALIRVGGAWYGGDGSGLVPLAEELPPGTFPEGSKRTVTINAYERSAKARSACIAHHGLRCSVCGLDFGEAFGTLGEGFIHVHHVVPIGTVGAEYEVDPIADLIPVCPNCHAMIHRVDPPLSVNQLKEHRRNLHEDTQQDIRS